MGLGQILFGFDGRLGRLAYLGYWVLAIVAQSLMTSVAGLLFKMGGNGPIVGGIITALIMGFGVWAMLALQVKRLHDIGYSGLHVIWITVLGLGTVIMAAMAPILAVIGGLMGLCVFLWLLFAPGQPEANKFGPSERSQSNASRIEPSFDTAWKSHSSRG